MGNKLMETSLLKASLGDLKEFISVYSLKASIVVNSVDLMELR